MNSDNTKTILGFVIDFTLLAAGIYCVTHNIPQGAVMIGMAIPSATQATAGSNAKQS